MQSFPNLPSLTPAEDLLFKAGQLCSDSYNAITSNEIKFMSNPVEIDCGGNRAIVGTVSYGSVDATVVVFRGTDSLANWIQNAECDLVGNPPRHKGFQQALDNILVLE